MPEVTIPKMTSEYSQLKYGKFYKPHNFEDVDESDGMLIKDMKDNIQKAFLNTNSEDAKSAFMAISRAIDLNQDRFRKYTLTTNDINALLEEIRNTEIYIQTGDGQDFYQATPETEDLPLKNNDIVFFVGG